MDENQHDTEQYRKCDLPRMVNLHQNISAPVYFIRYNPDQFEKDGKKHNPSDHKRKSTLIKWIECVKAYAKNGKVKDGLYVLYLFYNGYDEKTTWETIDPFMRIKR